MNPATLGKEGSGSEQMLYMAMEFRDVVTCYEAGRDGWPVLRVPEVGEEDARRLHRSIVHYHPY